MGCINDTAAKTKKIKKQEYQLRYQHSVNPIILIAKQWNVDIIKERWHDNQLDVVKAKFGPKTQKLSQDQFFKLLPELNNFSIITQDNFYDLFNFEENQDLSVNNFIISQIIFLKSDDYDLLSDMFFYVYSSAPNKTHMNTKDYNLFTKEFKEHQLQFMHQTIKPAKDQKGEIFINKKLFRQIFEQYDIKTIKNLFKFNLKDQERKLQKYLSTFGIDRANNAQVFMLDFQWFTKWKNYMEYKYGIKINVKENGKQLERQKNNVLLSTFKINQKWLKAGEKLASEVEDGYMEAVNNDRIQGDQVNELREGLVQFSEFISVPVEIWNQIRIIYGGGPSIEKPFPHFYNKRIMLTLLDQNKCEFQPGFWKAMVYDPNETFQEIYKKRQEKYFLKDSINEMVVYYKHPGELEWKKISDLSVKLENFPFQYKSYVVYVNKNVAQKFQDKFNITEVKGKKQIKQRVRNYGNLLNFQHEAILQQGHVGGIYASTIVLYLKSAKGQYQKIQSKISDLEQLNPSVLEDNFMQGFAGLENIGNTCYINATLQCLLKTPYFDEYMDSVNLEKRKDMMTYQLQQIHEKTKNSRDCISMSNFKKKFDEKFSFFEGSAQHDAQEFLLLLLDKLSQQQPRQSLIGDRSQVKQNKKIHTFFSGKTVSETQCLSCHNKGRTEQPFFTYSLSLPIINQTLFNFYLVDENYRVKKYGLTISRDCEVGQITRMIEQELRIDEENLLIMSVCEGEWMNDINKLSSSYKISKLQNYDSSVVCYPIKVKATPDYEDLIEGKTKNSIKIQIRNRVFDQKKKTFKPFHFPFFVQINHETTGKSLTFSIIEKIKKFINDEEYHLFKEFEVELEDQNIKLLGTNTTEKSKANQIQQNSPNKTEKPESRGKPSRQKIRDLPFSIKYLRKEDGMRSICWFCKKNIDHSSKKIDKGTDCEGCQFADSECLYQSRAFMKGFNSLVISIDWKSKLFSKDWTIEETSSYQNALKEQNARKSQLSSLLKEAADQEQSIELKCQKPPCKSNEALRRQYIIEAPNILILHLKRFYYKDNTFHKLKNKILIPEQFELPGFSDKYELYGNVVHYGSGTGRGGHYISYVKVNGRWYRCDDEKVNFTKDPKEHLNPDTYILFYKRQKIDRSWSFLGF